MMLMQLLCGRSPLLRDKHSLPALSHITILCGYKQMRALADSLNKNFVYVVLFHLLLLLLLF
jgi:hypothetical protein